MEVSEIIVQIRALDFYKQAQWDEYLGFFGPAISEREPSIPADPGSRGELWRRIRSGQGTAEAEPDLSISPKVVTVQQLARVKQARGMSLGMVSGVFDILHLEHLRCVQFARATLPPGTALCALLLSDRHIRVKKGQSRPVLNINERLAMMAAVRMVDHVVPLEHPDCLGAIETLAPDCLIKAGSDLSQGIVKRELDMVKSLGGKVALYRSATPLIMTTSKLIETVSKDRNGE